MESLDYSFTKGEFSIEQCRGIIMLVPKKDITKLGNWWPITLLNTDYKIVTKVLSHRLHAVIDRLISEDQAGYIKTDI